MGAHPCTPAPLHPLPRSSPLVKDPSTDHFFSFSFIPVHLIARGPILRNCSHSTLVDTDVISFLTVLRTDKKQVAGILQVLLAIIHSDDNISADISNHELSCFVYYGIFFLKQYSESHDSVFAHAGHTKLPFM